MQTVSFTAKGEERVDEEVCNFPGQFVFHSCSFVVKALLYSRMNTNRHELGRRSEIEEEHWVAVEVLGGAVFVDEGLVYFYSELL